MSAAGADSLSRGRFTLGLGASGPQVIEGFHGVPFEQPLRPDHRDHRDLPQVWRAAGSPDPRRQGLQLPLPADRGTGLGKPLRLINHPYRNRIPI